jgi:ribonuclease III
LKASQFAYSKLEEFERKLGLEFSDKRWLRQALVHRSFLNEKSTAAKSKGLESNQRLEFLGDAILGMIVADFLFQLFPERDEGGLTNLRSALVRRETLTQWAKAYDLGDYLLLGKGEAGSGGRERPLNLASAFEAVIGAIYKDKGLEAVKTWLMPLITKEIEVVLAEGRDQNYKSVLQVTAQRLFHATPVYQIVGEEGLEHERIFEVEVQIGEQSFGRGKGTTKQYAEQAAAKVTLESLSQG